jgi:hypothetical protein
MARSFPSTNLINRFFRLTRNYFYTALIICAMVLGIVGGGMSEHYIAKAMVKEKVRWFLVSTHSVSTCKAHHIDIADPFHFRHHSGCTYHCRDGYRVVQAKYSDDQVRAHHSLMVSLTPSHFPPSVIQRLTRLMFEAAIPPAVIATTDLILTQVLGPKLILWHLLFNHGLGKLYVISLLYTLNSIGVFSFS